MLAVSGSRRLRGRNRMFAAVREYAGMGWACAPGVRPLSDGERACSCDRIGCPAPGAHPVSATWRNQATVDTAVLKQWWAEQPQANIILPTGRVFDVFDVPAEAGADALARMTKDGVAVGPVAAVGHERHLFFVATRGAPVNEDEWWSCQLDCSPETVTDTPGMRWHCRDSYVVAPPSVLPHGRAASWIRPPDRSPLPDPLTLLEPLADSCERR